MATVQETVISSAWNHIFNFQRRDPPRRRSRKLLSLCHTHGGAPRSPYLPCQIRVQRENSELDQIYGMLYTKNREVEVVPVVDLIADSAFFCGQCNTGANTTVASKSAIILCPYRGMPPQKFNTGTSFSPVLKFTCGLLNILRFRDFCAGRW